MYSISASATVPGTPLYCMSETTPVITELVTWSNVRKGEKKKERRGEEGTRSSSEL